MDSSYDILVNKTGITDKGELADFVFAKYCWACTTQCDPDDETCLECPKVAKFARML